MWDCTIRADKQPLSNWKFCLNTIWERHNVSLNSSNKNLIWKIYFLSSLCNGLNLKFLFPVCSDSANPRWKHTELSPSWPFTKLSQFCLRWEISLTSLHDLVILKETSALQLASLRASCFFHTPHSQNLELKPKGIFKALRNVWAKSNFRDRLLFFPNS